MPITSAVDFLKVIRQLKLLEPAQLADVERKVKGKTVDFRIIAKKLIELGWLTSFQVNQVMQNKGHELQLGSYLLLDRLGEGGMGAVYKARHVNLGNIVAVKVVRKEKVASEVSMRRFQREIQAASKLNHQHIVRALDADQAGANHFLVMEYVEGADLGRRVKANGPLPVGLACECIRQAALGLQHAHGQGMIHRDIKPQNLLLTQSRNPPGGIVKILDMGLARLDDGDDEGTLTKEGSVLGSLDYLAPEQAASSHTADVRADLYSLGCTFFYLLTGKVPFPGGSAAEKIYKHQFDTPPAVDAIRPEVPAGVASVIGKLLAKKPDDRYQSADELLTALATIPSRALGGKHGIVPGPVTIPAAGDTAKMAGTAVSVMMPGKPGKRRLLVAGIMGGVAVVSLLGVVLLALPGGPSTPGKHTEDSSTQAKRPAGTSTSTTERKVPGNVPEYVTNRIGMKFKLIPAGTFTMGSPADEARRNPDEPQHQVTITKPFYMGIHEVTVGQFRQFLQDADIKWRPPRFPQTDEHPIVQVTWHNAVAFCEWLSKKDGRTYRLPTEAEWEYSCRAGSKTMYFFGADADQLSTYAWHGDNAGKATHPVAQLKPNAWGLYDMIGNVEEWCQDRYAADYYQKSPKEDPPGPSFVEPRVIRGGSWSTNEWGCRSANRSNCPGPTRRFPRTGFRVVLVLNKQAN